MGSFRTVYYCDPGGVEPVVSFLHDLPLKERVAIRNQIGRLNLLGDDLPHLPFPHSSQVEGELRELRCHFGRKQYRVLYQRSERLIVLLHAFPKAQKRIPQAEVLLAAERFRDFKERMNASRRRRPRAAGQDAP